jgi:hypothetical protein
MSHTNTQSAVPIEWSQLEPFKEFASQVLKSSSGKVGSFMMPTAGSTSGFRRDSQILSAPDQKLSAMAFAFAVSKDPQILSDGTHATITAVRTGMMLGLYVASQYAKASNLDALIAENAKSKMAGERASELAAKNQTASAIALYVTAAYAEHELSSYQTGQVESLLLEIPPAWPALSYASPQNAVYSMAFSLAAVLELSKLVSSDLHFVKVALLYVRKVVEEITQRSQSMQYAEPFTDVTYLFRGTDFSINGFTNQAKNGKAVSVKPTRFEDVVGNKDAKHALKRELQKLLCYDPVVRKNPLAEIAGISRIAMGSGDPGTGKTMCIESSINYLTERAKEIGIPTLIHPFPVNIVSTFQGGSAERAKDWFVPLADPSRIVYAYIDDAEAAFPERTNHNTSSGAHEVVGVFLVRTEGADAPNWGNSLIHFFTNIPDMVDAAVRSRIVARFRIDGARTHNDFLDQGKLSRKKYESIDPEFVDLKKPRSYEYFDDQKPMSSMSQLYTAYHTPKEESVRAAFAAADKIYDRGEADHFAHMCKVFQESHPAFTSRDYRNIQSAITARITDFDMPEEWFDNIDLFFKQSYDRKKDMLLELVKASMKGLKYSQIQLEEAMRYLDNWVKIQDLGFNREVDRRVNDLRIMDAAQKKYSGR